MKLNKLGLFLIFSVLSLTSCDYAYDYTYKVTNDTDSEVKIKVQTFQIDSTYSISANVTQILFVTDHGLEGSKGPYFEDVAEEINEFVVTKNDTLVSTKDYLENSSWDYDDGLYHTTIEDIEFE